MEEKKKRGSNYTPAEKDMLLELVKKNQNIIENKETNAHMLLKKREVWNTICRQYNAVSVSGCRTWQQLRHLYENIKQRSKKNIATANRLQYYEITKDIKKKASIDKKEINRTGGGTYKSTLSEQDAQILAMAAPQIQPLANYYDDAALYFGDTEPELLTQSDVYTAEPDIHTIEDQDATMAYITNNTKPCTVTSNSITEDQDATVAYITNNTKPCTVTSNSIADNQDATMASIMDNSKPIESKSIADDQRAATAIPREKNKPSTSYSAGRIKPSQNGIKQQYFRTKLKNAKLETKYWINKNKMENNIYKAKMQFWKRRLQNLK